MDHFDYIIVGAGSAGCILAERLSADAKTKVLLLEAGPKDRTPWAHIPIGYGKLYFNKKYNWKYAAAPQAGLSDRREYWPRGKMIGGSGAINAMVYARGLPHDFDDWRSAGAKGWGWDDLEPWFDKLETRVDQDGTAHGKGPIHVQNVSDQMHRSTKGFFQALEELELPTTENYNGPAPEGGTYYQLNTKEGKRCASSSAFLHAARHRKNLSVKTGLQVSKVLIVDGRAIGVETIRRSKRNALKASNVILCAGSVGTPQILQLSGIGPGKTLQAAGVDVLFNNPNIGGNLQDHLAVNYSFRSNVQTLNRTLSSWHGRVGMALRYLFKRRGPMSLSVNQAGGYFRSSPSEPVPDQQLYFNPMTYQKVEKNGDAEIVVDPFPGFIISHQPSRPTSRGRIDIASPDAMKHPIIAPNGLSTAHDEAAVIAGGRLCAKILSTQALTAMIKSPISVDPRDLRDVEILENFRAHAGTVFHPVSTCKIGESETFGGVDPELKVFGVSGLHVVDASVFPNITSANTNAPTMVVALKAADMILREQKTGG